MANAKNYEIHHPKSSYSVATLKDMILVIDPYKEGVRLEEKEWIKEERRPILSQVKIKFIAIKKKGNRDGHGIEPFLAENAQTHVNLLYEVQILKSRTSVATSERRSYFPELVCVCTKI